LETSLSIESVLPRGDDQPPQTLYRDKSDQAAI
jgi:hypothetical protein